MTKQPSIKTDRQFDINYIDASRLSTFCRCPAKLFFERLLGLQSPTRNTAALDFGTCHHESLPLCYETESVPYALELFEKNWFDFGHGEDDKKRNTARGVSMIKNFARERNVAAGKCPYKRLSFPDIAMPDANRVSKDEIPFIVDIGGPLAACGRIDLPVEWMGSKWPLDFKTCSEMGPRFFKCFETSAQTAIYTIAMMNLTGDNDIKGIIIEGIRVSTSNDEVSAMPIFANKFWLEQFLEYTNSKSEQILICNGEKEWPQNFSSCNPYGMFGQPGYTCQYLSLCQAPDWHSMVPTFKQEEPWHPLKGIS